MKKKEPKIADPITVIPRINMLLSVALVLAVGLCLFLTTIVVKVTVLDPDPIVIHRLYDDPEQNDSFFVERGAHKNKLSREDVTQFVTYLVDLFDLKSKGSIRLMNYRRLLALSEGEMKQTLENKKGLILRAKTGVKLVQNEFVSVTFEAYTESPDIVLAKARFKQVVVFENKKAETNEQIVTFALKKVLKKFYQDSKNIGGKYYGLVLVDCSTDIAAI